MDNCLPAFNSLYGILKEEVKLLELDNVFQFPLWDSKSVNWGCIMQILEELSIPFMGFLMFMRLERVVENGFQFPLWDSGI